VPDVSGTRHIAGLSAPVRIVRDRWGIPHIYASNADDLFFAQGFVQAQDRLFQMDLWRRSALGRLSEVLGSNFADRDAATRRIQYTGDVEAEWRSYAPDTRAIVTAFVRGINAWVALARERPPEEFVLAGWLPEPWAPEDLLNRTDSFVAGRTAVDKIFRARIVAALGPERAAAVLPREAIADIPRGLDPAVVTSEVADAIRSVGAPPFFLGLAAGTGALPRVGTKEPDERRADVPLDVRTLPLPAPHYLVHLHAPGWSVIGGTPPWMPGVADGHNDALSWETAPVEADAQDVYVERMNPENPHQVEFEGLWVDTDLVKDPLAIRRRDKPLVFDRERTRHGAILAVDRARHLAFTVRWLGADAGGLGDLIALELDRASTVNDVEAAIARWVVPARSITVSGRDGVQLFRAIAGKVPTRTGWRGLMPGAGWTGADEWTVDGARRLQPSDPAPGASGLAILARRHSDRVDALLRDLVAATSRPDAPIAMRAILVNAAADALRDDGGPGSAVLFAHPLAISEATRRRFDIGPLRPGAPDTRAFAVVSSTADWDRSMAMNAPGQAGAPSSAHYADLVRPWRDGTGVPLAFGDRAVSAAAESTLTLTPAEGSAAR